MDSAQKNEFLKDINGKSGLKDDIPQVKLDFKEDNNRINNPIKGQNDNNNMNNNLYTHNPYLQNNERNIPYVPMNGNLMGPNNFPFKPNNNSFGARYDPISPFGSGFDFAPQYDEFGIPMNPQIGNIENRRNQGFNDINPFGNVNFGNNNMFGGGFGGGFNGGFGGGFI